MSDPRIARSRSAVCEATLDLLRESGYSGLSIDAVSKRSGVARTTIYRHYDSVAALTLDALESLRPPEDVVVTDDPVADLRAQLQRIIVSVGTGVLPTIIDGAARDPEFRRLRHEYVTTRRAETRRILERLLDAGELSPEADLEIVMDMVVAPIFYRMLLSDHPTDDEFVERIICQLLR